MLEAPLQDDEETTSAARELESLPYPWMNTAELANVLDDPDVWSDAVSDLELRRVLLRVARPPLRFSSSRLGRRVNVDDDSGFGYEMIDLLQDPKQLAASSRRLRAELERCGARVSLGVPEILAECLVRWIQRRHDPGGPITRFLPDALEPSIVSSRLTADRFRELMDGLAGASTSIDIPLMACAQAMLRPHEGRRYAEALRTNPSLDRYVVCYWDSADCVDDAKDHPLDDHDLPEDAEETEVPPPPVRKPRRQPRRTRPIVPPITPAPPRAVAAEPTVDPDEIAVRMRLRERISRALEDLAIPGLEEPPGDPVAVQTTAQLAEVERQLPTLAEAVAELRRHAALAGISPPWPSRGQVVDLQGFIEEVQLAAIELEDSHNRRLADVQVATAACERLAATVPSSGLSTSDLVAVLRAMDVPDATDALRRLRTFRDSDEFVSGVLAELAHADLDRGLSILVNLSPAMRARAAAGLRLEHLPRAAEEQPELAALLTRSVLIAAVRGDWLETAAPYLEQLVYAADLPAKWSALTSACARAASRGEPVADLLRELSADSGGPRVDAHAGRLLELIDRPAGMVGIYHRLRVIAQERFFRPLRGEIVAGDTDRALALWQAAGDDEDMLAACICELPDAAHRELDDNHIEQTRRYLRQFAGALLEWADGGGALRARAGLRDVVTAWSECPPSDEWARQLALAVQDGQAAGLAPADFGRRYTIDQEGVLCLAADLPVAPTLVESWIHRCDGRGVPVAIHLADLVRASPENSTTCADAVRTMLARQRFAAAQRAASGDPSLAAQVQRELLTHRRLLEARFADPLKEARGLRTDDAAIDDYLADLEAALLAADMVQAEWWLSDLREFLVERERERDPDRRQALEFLAELPGALDLRHEPRDRILERVAHIRATHEERRWHLVALEAEHSQPPPILAVVLRTLAAELDRPTRWPDAGVSLRLADAIEVIVRFLTRQVGHYRHYDSASVDAALLAAADWFAQVLRAGLPGAAGLAPVFELAAEIRDFAPVQRVIELLTAGRQVSALSFVNAAQRRRHASDQYSLGEYGACASLLAGDPEAELLRHCAQIMAMLYKGAPLDIPWGTLRGVLACARRADGVTADLDRRLAALTEITEVFVRIGEESRVIDHLARPSPSGTYDPSALRAVLFALSLHVQVCERKAPTEAFSLAMVLPEQIFRVWARWRLGLDMARVPQGRRMIWQMVEAVWESGGRGNSLRIPAPGEPFPSFRSFALFAQHELLVRGGADALERNVDDLHAAFRILRIRNDGAHALSRPGDAQREQYFRLIRRWLGQLYLACPTGNGPALQREVAGLMDPLPV